MCRYRSFSRMIALLATLLIAGCSADANDERSPRQFGFGKVLADSGRWIETTAIPPDGEGLPPGRGTSETGEQLYIEQCANCHGPNLKGTTLGMPLIGGRGTLTGDSPLATVESFWPYAPPLFSYIRNTMPINRPGSLSDDEAYALAAFILSRAEIISADTALDSESLPTVRMPNRDGFIPDPRPDVAAENHEPSGEEAGF